MNRNLLAGAAAIALALGAGTANAQAKFDLKIGGDAFFQAGFVDQDRDTNRRSTEFNNRFRLNIVASAKADNGLEYGARLRLRNNTNDRVTEADRGYMFLNGSFGHVRLGVSNSYSDDLGAVFRPIDYSFLGFWDEPVNWASTGNGTGINTAMADLTLTDNSRGTKVFYASPRFSGFQVGGSFTPQPSSNFTDIDRVKNTTAGYQDIWEIGVNYTENFSGVGVKAGVGYTGGRNELSTVEGLSAVQAGLSIDYAGFTLGGGYINKYDSGLTKASARKSNFQVWNIGAQYVTGPITVGAGYTHGSGEGSQAIAGKDKQDYYSIGANYKVAPGLVVGAEYAYVKFDDETNLAANDDKANVFIVRSWLSF